MRIEYDPEAVELTEAVLQGLTAAGYQDFVRQSHDALAEAEAIALSFLERASGLLHRGNPLTAFDLLGADVKARPMSPSWLLTIGIAESMTVGEFLGIAEVLQRDNPRNVNRQLRMILAELLSRLAPDEVHKPDVPFNAIVAMNAAFHVLVAPRRCFAHASQLFQELGYELEVTDASGARVYGAAEQESAFEGEVSFWRLWNQADAIWRFHGFLEGVQGAIQQFAPEQIEAVDETTQRPLIVLPRTARSVFDVKTRFAVSIQEMLFARPEGLAA